MTERHWRIDPGVARDLSAALGWSGHDGVAALAVRLPERVPCGTTAKLAAIAVGELPPGAEVDHLARRVLDHQLDLARRPEGGAPSPSWSCWVLGSVMAALVDAAELGPVRLAATRRIDEGSPVVDLHAAVLVDVDGRTEVADPFFGLSLSLPAEAGEPVADDLGAVAGWAEREPDGRWTLGLRMSGWGGDGLRYRVLAPELDRDDLAAVCAVSVTYTGVPSRPYARIHVDGAVLDAHEDAGGAGVVRWRPHRLVGARRVGATTDVHRTWAEAVDHIATETGTRLV